MYDPSRRLKLRALIARIAVLCMLPVMALGGL